MTVQAGETNWVDEIAVITGSAGAMGGTVVRALIERGALAQAMLYIGLSVVVCLLGLYLGLLISRGGAA